jgi:glutamyl-tRNA reductase
VGSVAADLAEDIFGDLATATGLVIGAGEVGEKTARALLARGLRELVLTNRTAAHADDLAVTLGARAVPFQALDSLLAQVDILLSSTASPVPILGLERVSRALDRRKRPLFLIDLALPRDIDPSVGALPDVFLYNLDDLAAIAETNRKAREAELATARMEVQRRALAAWQAVAQRGSV